MIHSSPWRTIVRLAGVLAAMVVVASPCAVAQRYTLGDVVARVKTADSIAGFETRVPVVHAHLLSLEAFFRASNLLRMSLDSVGEIYSGSNPGFTTILRLNRDSFAELPRGLIDSLTWLRRVAAKPLRDSVEKRIGPDSSDALYKPLDDWTDRGLKNSVARNGTILHRYGVKYGPEAPKLNVAEALVNYVLQLPRGSPFAGSDNGPSPLEFVAAYRPVTLSTANSADSSTSVRAATSAQVGFRLYNFDEKCGTGNVIERIMNACHYSAGWYMLGPKDAAPLELLHNRISHGFYGAVANYHVGVIVGSERRVAFGVDTQILPFLY